MHLLGLSRRAGTESGIFLWNGAIAACGDRWTAAIDLLQGLRGRRIAEVVSFNAAMERCNEEWKMTCQLYADMYSRGLKSTEISAFLNSGRVERCWEAVGHWGYVWLCFLPSD